MRRILMLLILCTALAGCTGPGFPSPVAPPVAPSPATTTVLTMPNVVGMNAAVATDRLKKIGFTNIDLGTVDGHEFVVLPQNWTVRTQSAAPGDKLTGDAKIVLGCARNG
jgi:hypothetical protein